MNECWFSKHFNIEGIRKINRIASIRVSANRREFASLLKIGPSDKCLLSAEGRLTERTGPGDSISKTTWTPLSWKVALWSQSYPVPREGKATLGPLPLTGADLCEGDI